MTTTSHPLSPTTGFPEGVLPAGEDLFQWGRRNHRLLGHVKRLSLLLCVNKYFPPAPVQALHHFPLEAFKFKPLPETGEDEDTLLILGQLMITRGYGFQADSDGSFGSSDELRVVS